MSHFGNSEYIRLPYIDCTQKNKQSKTNCGCIIFDLIFNLVQCFHFSWTFLKFIISKFYILITKKYNYIVQ